jgi:hypothetical protein
MSTRMAKRSLLTILALAGCGTHQHVFVPAAHATGMVAGQPAAQYRLPPESPRGDMLIAAIGVLERAHETRVIHVREIVLNSSDQPWQLDAREQRLVVNAGTESRPEAHASEPFVFEIPAHGQRVIDLVFPLPAVGPFDILWSVRTDARTVTERTPFDAIRTPSTYVGRYHFPMRPIAIR